MSAPEPGWAADSLSLDPDDSRMFQVWCALPGLDMPAPARQDERELEQ